MPAVKYWRQSDLIVSHLPLCPGLHIVLKYVLSNQLDRKPKQKTQNTKMKRKRKKTTKTHSRQAIVENEKQTSPFHSMALPSWMARDGKMFESLKVGIFLCFYFCLFSRHIYVCKGCFLLVCPKNDQCQTLRKFWHLEFFRRDLHVIWHFVIF